MVLLTTRLQIRLRRLRLAGGDCGSVAGEGVGGS